MSRTRRKAVPPAAGRPDDTRRRLFDAAGALFAEHGFRGASVRQICAHAGANLAAVKYHYGSKEALYRAVLVETHRELRDGEPLPRLADHSEPAEALRAWIGFMLRLLLVRRGSHPFAGRLIGRELLEPSAALGDLVREVIAPVRGELETIVRALAGGTAGRVARLTNFVLGLCAFHELGRPVLTRFGAAPPQRPQDVERLADAICAFALHGLRGAERSG